MSEPDPELTPEQEARVRRLLAEARHDEPMPGDVAARLDRVIAGLAETPVGQPGRPGQPAPSVGPRPGGPPTGWTPPPMDDLEAARRRRRVRRGGLLLAAAAVVVVAGVGIGGLVGSEGGDEAGSAGAGSDPAAQDLDRADPDGGTADDDGDTSGESGAQPPVPSEVPESTPSAPASPLPTMESAPSAFAEVPRPPYRLTGQGFGDTVQRLRTVTGLTVGAGDVVTGDELSRSPAFLCEPAVWGPGELLPAVYDGLPAVLVYRPTEGATQTVELLRCGNREVLRSTVIPAG